MCIRDSYNLVPILNVHENIVLPVELDGDTVDQKFLDEIVHLLGLEDKLKMCIRDRLCNIYSPSYKV